MISYKLYKDSTYVEKLIDGKSTGEWHKVDASKEYLKWLDEGNTPEPAEETV